MYALHAPEVECIGKGKARKPYEFDVKVSVAVTHKQGLMVGARSFAGNPYDGHTLNEQVGEAGVAGFEAYAWQGFVAPKGTPPAVIKRLNDTFAAAMKDPGIQKRLADAGVEPLTSTSERAAAYMASETQRWSGVIKTSNISLD